MLSPEGPVYQAGTLSGNPIATTAGLATLRLATDDVYAHLDRRSATTIKDAAAEALSEAGVPHTVQSAGTMFSVFFADGPVRDFEGAQRQDTAAFAAFFHAMLDRGVYLPPSAYEAWFVSAAHDERAVQTVLDALPQQPRPPPRPRPPPGKEPMADTTVVHLLRHGEVHNPEGVLYGRRDGYHLSDLGRADGRSGSPTRSPTATSSTCAPRRSSGRRRPPPRWPRRAASTPVVDPRVIESANVFEGKRFGVGDGALRKPSAWVHLWNPLEARRGASPTRRSPRRMLAAVYDARDAARGHEAVIVSHQLPIWITRLRAREALLPARPAQAPVHAVLAHLAALRRRRR